MQDLENFEEGTSKCRAGECRLPSQVQGHSDAHTPAAGILAYWAGGRIPLPAHAPPPPLRWIKAASGDSNVQPQLTTGDPAH